VKTFLIIFSETSQVQPNFPEFGEPRAEKQQETQSEKSRFFFSCLGTNFCIDNSEISLQQSDKGSQI